MKLPSFSLLAGPFLPYLIGAGLALLTAGGWYLHHSGFKAGEAKQLKHDQAALKAASTKLHSAADSLRAAGTAIGEINAEAKRRALESAANKKRADEAGVIAIKATQDLRRRSAIYAEQIERARRKPSCQALLAADVAKECGL